MRLVLGDPLEGQWQLGIRVYGRDGTMGALEPVKERIRRKLGLIRNMGADFLTYAVIDAVIAHWGRELFSRYSSSPENFESERRFVFFLMHGLAIRRRGGADPAEVDATLEDVKSAIRRTRERLTDAATSKRSRPSNGRAGHSHGGEQS